MDEISSEAAPAAGAAPTGESPERRAKLDAAAARKRDERAAKKAKTLLKEKKNRQLAKDAGTLSPEDQQATQAEPVAQDVADDGWPDDSAIAKNMPGARMMLSGLTTPLMLTRYGQMAFTPQTAEVTQANGTTKKVTVDPVDLLAEPIAAMLAGNGRRATPGMTLLVNSVMVLGPPAVALSVVMVFEYLDERKKRAEGQLPKKNGATAPELPATPAQKPVSA